MFGAGQLRGLSLANKVLAMCRGILYCYVALELDELEPHTAPGATFACDGLEIPVPIYPLEQTLGIAPRQWVAVFPHMRRDGQELTVADKVTGQPLLVHGFDYADMKWQSRLAYRLKKSLATRMRDIERVYWSTGILIELTDIISASDDEDVMRFDIMFPQGFGEATVDPARVLALGSCSQAIVMEDCLGDDGKRHVYLSMRVPHDDAQTLVLAQDSDDAGCQPGLLVIDAPMRADKARETWEKMASACDDPTYPHWLIRHRAQGFELCAQREEGREWSVGALVIVDRIDVTALRQCMAALRDQSVPLRGVCLMGSGARRAHAQARAEMGSRGVFEVANDVTHAREALGADYLLVMDQHDILEPNALYELTRRLRDDDAALLAYPDDDQVDKALAAYRSPRLKSDLDIDALYAGNYIGSCALVRASALDDLAVLDAETAEQWVYGAALRSSMEQGAVAHVPRVLCHRRDRKHGAHVPASDPQVLADHLHARDVSAHIVRDDVCNKVIYEVSDPQRLLSIVIPTKDHAPMLADCIESILDKAGYDAFEIVLVENNSVEPETFAFYEDIVNREERVKVVTYEGDFNFSKIVNYGVAQSKGELVLVLNNDTKAITDGFVRIMAGYLERPEVGVVGPLLRYPDGLVQNAGIALMTSGCLGFMNQNRAPECDRGYLDSLAHPREYSAVLGACFMMRRADFDAVGGLTEELAVTYNDVDFCWKLRERGLACVFTPYAELYHLEFASRGRDRVNERRAIQTELEAGIMRQRWPHHFACGDPLYNPACDQANPYFKLGR